MAELEDNGPGDDILAAVAAKHLKSQNASTPKPKQAITDDYINSVLNGESKKKDLSASGAQNGLHQSPNGSASSPSSQDNSIDNAPGFRKPNIVPTSTDVGVPFEQAHKIIANMPNEGSYSNLPQHLANKLTSTVSNGLAGLAGIVRNQTPNGNLPLYDKDGNISDYGQSVDHDASTDPIGRFILTLNGATKAENQQNTANPLPQTVMGKITGGTIDVAPDIATTALMPEAEAPEALSALSKLKSAIWNPFTKVLTGKGFINSVNEGAQRGETSDEQLKSGAIGAGNGFVNGGTMGLLGGIAGGISEPIFKGMDKIGLVSAGNSALTKSGVKTVADANLFAALPLVTAGGEHIYNKLIGAKDDPNLWKNAKEEAQTGFGMGLGFGAMDVFHALGEDAHSKAQIAEVHNDRQAIALQNFITADPEAITQAFKNPTPTGDLNAQAVEYAHKAMQENDADKKQQLILVAQTLAKSSDVKGVTQAILSDKNGFLAHINQSDIPDAMKKQITEKVNLIHSQLDPAEQQKQALGQKINSIDQDIAQIQPQADNEPDIVKKTDAEVGIENLNKTRDEFIKELKGITVKQHEDMQKNSGPVDYTPVELPENKEPFMNYEQQDNSEQNNNSPLNITENESTKSSEEAKQESSPQGSTENELPTEKEVVNPDGGKKPSDTTNHAKQKAIDAITHGIIGDGQRKEGDTSPRFDLDMPTVEQERAIRHIIKGKYDSVAAKKMIDKVMEWEAKNQYPIIEGLGGGSIRTRDATSEEIQNHIDDAKANKIGELSPRQVEEHNQAAKELGITPEDAKRYEEYQQSGIGTKAGTPEISARPVQQSENDTATGTTQDNGDKAPQGGNEPTTGEPAGHKSEPTGSGSAEPVKPKVKIDKYELIQPSHLKGTDYHLALGEFQDGKFGIIDTQTKNRISNLYDSKWEAINTYEKNREKLTPKIVDDYIAKTKKIEFPDETPKAKIVPLSEKGKTAIDKDIEPHGITYDQIKAYEQARSNPDAGLPDGDTKEPGSVQKDVRQTDDKSGSTDKNTEGEGVREQPEKSASAIKEEKIRKKIEDNKKEFMKAVRETRKKGYSNPLDPELIAKGVKLMASYAELGIHKFSEIAKDFIGILGKDNFTDDDADALKAAYFAHVANLDPKERKPFDSLKDVDTFMGDGMKLLRGQEPKASLPERTIPEKERLPVEQPEKTEKDAKENYKWLGKFKDNRVRNLEQLKQFAKDVGNFDPLREVRKFATSKSQASIILKTATQKIIGLVGKDGWQNLREALVESRLRGVKQRWNNFAEDIANKTDSETKQYFADGKTGQMYDLLDNLKGISEENSASFASSLIAAGRYEDARKYLSDVFKQTADNTLTLGKLSNGKTFDEQVQNGQFTDPKMQKALQAYKDFIEKPIAESHESNDGIFSDALGDLETYYPLTPTAQQDKHFIAGAKPYKAPLNPNNRFATGQSENYSREIADLSDNLAKSIKTNNKANAIESLKKAGLIVDIPHSEKETGTITLNGETYKAVKVKVAEGRTIIENGQIFNTQSKYVAMPVWLDRELKPIFDANSDYDKYSALGDTLNSLVKYQLGGPIEATAHSMRLLGGITNSMPFMQEWAYKNGVLGKAGGIVANNPIVKTFVGMGKILFTDLKSDKALQTIQEMAKNGDIPEKTWTKTWSREFAELTGAKASRIKIGKLDIPNITDFSPILYGKRSLDLKARVTMYNLTKAMNPDATPEMHTKMQQQLGVYTKSLQSNLERFVKHHGIAPFYSFGSAIYREGIKAVVSASALPLERPTLREALTTGIGAKQAAKLSGYKAAQLLSTGILGTTAYWMFTYHAQAGMWPWEDPKSKFLRNPFPEFAKNDFTEKYFKNKKTGEWDDIDFAAYANPYLNRGLRAFGAPKIWETNQLGGTGSQTAEAGFLQALNTSISPYTSSPVAQLALNQVSGSAPYITNNRDDKGKPSVGLYRKVRTMPTFLQQQAANAEVGFQSLNPVANFIGSEATNMMGIKSFQSHADEDDASVMSSFKFAFGIAFPRIITPHGDDDKKASFIQKEADATAKEADKEAE